MVITSLWILGIVALVWGAIMLARLRAEDPGQWEEIHPAGVQARMRLHPGWKIPADSGSPITTGVRGAVLRVTERARDSAGGDLEARLDRLVTAAGLTLDEPAAERFQAVSGPGLRIASAGTGQDGGGGWFEFQLVEGPGRDLSLAYRGPVLSGSVDTRTLSRTAESIRYP